MIEVLEGYLNEIRITELEEEKEIWKESIVEEIPYALTLLPSSHTDTIALKSIGNSFKPLSKVEDPVPPPNTTTFLFIIHTFFTIILNPLLNYTSASYV